MANKLWIIVGIVFVFHAAGCHKKVVSEASLYDYVNDETNRLRKKINDGLVDLEVRNRPGSLLASESIKRNNIVDKSGIDSIVHYYEEFAYFDVIMSCAGSDVIDASKSKIEYDKLMNILLFEMGPHITLVGNSDTIPLINYSYTRMYGAPNNRMMFVYNKKDIVNYKKVCFVFNLTFLGEGISRVEFDTEDILKAPKLKF